MQLKKRVPILLFSVMAVFALVPLGAYGGHSYKFSAAVVLYFLITWYFLRKAATLKEKVWTIILVLLPPTALYLPLHLMDFEGTQLAMPSSAAHLIGIGAGALVSVPNKALKFSITTLTVLLCVWTTSKGYDLWMNKLNFGTYTSSVSELSPQFSVSDSEGNAVTNKNFTEKLVVLDFWNTGCGVCFRKFPVLQQKAQAYKDHPAVEFYAVNIPLPRDTAGQGKQTMKKLGYTFQNLFASGEEVAKTFGVSFYPTVLIVKNGKEIIYRGNIEGVEDKLNTLLNH